MSFVLFLCSKDAGLSGPSSPASRGALGGWAQAAVPCEGSHQGFGAVNGCVALTDCAPLSAAMLLGGGQARVKAFNLLIMINNPMLNLYLPYKSLVLLVHEQIADLRQCNCKARTGEPGQLCCI